jgi:Glycosyl transferase family 2
MAPSHDPSSSAAQAPPRDDTVPRLPSDAVLATIGRFATRYPDSAWLDMLALRATGGASSADELVARVRAGDVDGIDGRDLAWFGYVLAAELGGRATLDDVAEILGRALATDPKVAPRVRGVWLQALLLTGRLEAGVPGPGEDEVEPEQWWAAATDLLNPFRGGSAEEGRWLASLSRPFTDAGLAPLRLADGSEPPFDRLATDPVAPVEGDLVSVVMPVHDPDHSLLTSVRSVLAQSWTNLEVLLCDDASTTGLDLLERCADLDPRVRLLRAPRNAGAYSARNLGLEHATGRYLTFQDADDYSHPQRVERQVGVLGARRGALATVGHSVRASSSLHVTSLGLKIVALTLPTLLVEREPVLGALGAFDPVRRSADREFLLRLQAAFGRDALVTLPEPLAVYQLTPGSLSRGDMGFLRRHAARQAYATAAGAWHRQIEQGAERAHLEPGTRAPFAAPSYIATGSASEDAGSVDVVVMANHAANAPADLGPLVDALCADGTRVGVVEFPGPRDAGRSPDLPGDALAARFRTGAARWVLPGERVRAGVAMVHDPAAVLTMPASRLAATDVDHLVLVADRIGDYDAAAVATRAAQARGGPVHWLPVDDTVGQALREAVPGASVLPAAPWLVTPLGPRPSRPLSTPAVVGLLPPRDVARPVRTAWERGLVPRDEDTTVWCFGRGRSTVGGRSVVRVHPPDVGWSDFLDRVDFLVLPPASTTGLARHVVEAWAHGTVVIADDGLRPHLGDAATYLEGGSVDACIERHRQDPALHTAVQQRALDRVRRHATPEGLLAAYGEVLRAVGRR